MEHDYLKIARALIARGDEEELIAVFRLRDSATGAMVRQCCLADEPDDKEVADWLDKFPANRSHLKRSLERTGQKIKLS